MITLPKMIFATTIAIALLMISGCTDNIVDTSEKGGQNPPSLDLAQLEIGQQGRFLLFRAAGYYRDDSSDVEYLPDTLIVDVVDSTSAG